MRKLIIFVIVLWIFSQGLPGQDRFPPTRLTFGFAQNGFPTWSPNGKYLVYALIDMRDSTGRNGLWKINLEDTTQNQIFSGLAEHPRWSPDGRSIVFDADTGQTIRIIPVNGGKPIDFLPDSIHIVNGGMPCWSPDGSRIAFMEGSTSSLWVYELPSGEFTKIFENPGHIMMPACWTPDGKSVLISLRPKESYECAIWSISSDGKEQHQITGHNQGHYRYLELSPDGSILAYGVFNMENRTSSIWFMPMNGGQSIKVIDYFGFNESPSFSPDGHHLAFTSTRSGFFDVWMMDLDIDSLKSELGIK